MSSLRRGWILKEGYPFIAPPLAVGVLGYALGWSLLGFIGLLGGIAIAFFFRNPLRRPIRLPYVALAPADGRVVEKAQVESGDSGSAMDWRISIFMSVFNVHVNRSPVAGKILSVRHEPGAFLPAHRGETSIKNERNIVRILIDGGKGMSCVQVAGVLARRIVCWVETGKKIGMGEPFGLIRFGSRVDCYFPADFDPDVRLGQRVWGGETILGYFQREASSDG